MIENFRVISVIIRYTLIELIKSKVLLNTLFLGIGLILLTFVAKEFTYGVPERVAIDFGLGSLSLSSVAIAIFMGVGLMSKEIQNRTAYIILGRPVSRAQFIIGKVVGMIAVLAINVSILFGLTLFSAFLWGGQISSLLYWIYLLSILEASMVLLIIVNFSMVTNNTLSVIYTLSLFVLGHGVKEAKETMMAQNVEVVSLLIKIYEFIFPNFSKLNLKDYVLYEQTLSNSVITMGVTYAFSYLAFLMVLAIFVFYQKSLD